MEVVYTDGVRSETGRTAVAWHAPTRHDKQRWLAKPTWSVCSGELGAILMMVREATQKQTGITEKRVFMDLDETL